MSTTVLKLIPASPSYVPDNLQEDSAKSLLSKLYKDEQIEIVTTDAIEFVDQGENFESVACDLCGHNIDIEEWQAAMDKAYEQQFEDLTFVTSCCQKKTSLNDLSYHWPAGFAKFVIAIEDAKHDLQQQSLNELQQVLGTKLKAFWAHY